MSKIVLTKESETLYIPLCGKAEMSRQGKLLDDPKAEAIASQVDYDFSKLHSFRYRYISIYMAIRAATLDEHANSFLKEHPDAAVLHLGCGLDTRVDRVTQQAVRWYDLDLPDVMAVRGNYYKEKPRYQMLSSSVTELSWLDQVQEHDTALVIAEGLTMYLTEDEIRELCLALRKKFRYAELIFDAYSESAVRWSKWKNPVNRMGAQIRWGLDEPKQIEQYAQGIRHKKRNTSRTSAGSTSWRAQLAFGFVFCMVTHGRIIYTVFIRLLFQTRTKAAPRYNSKDNKSAYMQHAGTLIFVEVCFLEEGRACTLDAAAASYLSTFLL